MQSCSALGYAWYGLIEKLCLYLFDITILRNQLLLYCSGISDSDNEVSDYAPDVEFSNVFPPIDGSDAALDALMDNAINDMSNAIDDGQRIVNQLEMHPPLSNHHNQNSDYEMGSEQAHLKRPADDISTMSQIKKSKEDDDDLDDDDNL